MHTLTFLPLLLAPTFAGAPPDVPPIFAKLDFKEARAKAATEGKLMILDAMTSWCGPCKVMDATTWVDAVVTWIEANAVAIQLDMDEHTDVKTALGINAFPTVVVFSGGREFDRVVGLKRPAELLTWLTDAKAGKRALDRVKADLEAAREGEGTYYERARLAAELLAYSDYDEALTEYAWLWANVPADDARAAAYRRTSWGMEAHQLTQQHAPARELFEGVRKAIAHAVQATSDLPPERERKAYADWIQLSSVLDDEASIAAWASGLHASGTPDDLALLRHFEREVFGVLVDHGRWAAAGQCLASPVADMRQKASTLGAYDLPAAERRGGIIPAIPMGGMRPAAAVPKPEPNEEAGDEREDTTSEDETTDDPQPKPKSIPAIPLGGMRPAAAADPAAAQSPRPAPKTDAEIRADIRLRLEAALRLACAERYAALLAAGRGGEADEVASVVLDATDDARSRAALVATALRAGVLGERLEQHQRWLDEAAW